MDARLDAVAEDFDRAIRVRAFWAARALYLPKLPSLARAFAEAVEGLGVASAYRTPTRILHEAPGGLWRDPAAKARLMIQNSSGSAYGLVLLPRCTIGGELAPRLPAAFSGFTVRFSDHVPVRKSSFSFDPVNEGSIEECLAVLRYHLFGEGRAPMRCVSKWRNSGIVNDVCRYSRDRARLGMNPWEPIDVDAHA